MSSCSLTFNLSLEYRKGTIETKCIKTTNTNVLLPPYLHFYKSWFPFNVSWEGYILLLGRDAFALCFLSSFFLSPCFQIWLMSVAVHWSTSDVRPMQLCYNEPVKCALEGCNAIYYAWMKCTNTMKLCTTDMIQFSQVSRRHSVIHFKCNFFVATGKMMLLSNGAFMDIEELANTYSLVHTHFVVYASDDLWAFGIPRIIYYFHVFECLWPFYVPGIDF